MEQASEVDRLREEVERLRVERDRALAEAFTDPLTGLHNRRAFKKAVERELTRIRGYRTKRDQDRAALCLAFVDLDNFKAVNDTHGHDAGDRVLLDVARLVRARVRESDVVARWGGDEFAIMLLEPEGDGILPIATRLVEEVSALSEKWPGTGLGCSIGIASYGYPPPSLEVALNAADRAMYRAKQAGKNRVEWDAS